MSAQEAHMKFIEITDIANNKLVCGIDRINVVIVPSLISDKPHGVVVIAGQPTAVTLTEARRVRDLLMEDTQA